MLVHFLCELSPCICRTLILQLDLMSDLDVLSSVGKASSFHQDPAGYSACVEEMIDLLKSDVCSLWKEEVNSRNDYHQVERGEEYVGTPVDVLNCNLQNSRSVLKLIYGGSTYRCDLYDHELDDPSANTGQRGAFSSDS